MYLLLQRDNTLGLANLLPVREFQYRILLSEGWRGVRWKHLGPMSLCMRTVEHQQTAVHRLEILNRLPECQCIALRGVRRSLASVRRAPPPHQLVEHVGR